MKRVLSVLIVGLGLILGLAAFKIDLTILIGSGGASTPFTPLHTYFMSPTGNDSNNGTSTSTAWLTPNHAVVCGDVIIAQSGDYSSSMPFASWGTVSNCPSTTGGIDGAGGIYFAILLCGGSDLEACHGTTGPVDNGAMMNVNQNYWAVEGWKISGNGGVSHAFQSNACASGTTVVHHNAFINDISFNSATGFNTGDCALNHNVPGNGVDYWAVIGSIAQNSAQDPICVAAIDDVGPANVDTTAGTHVMVYGNFSYNNLINCGSDGEAYMFDTFDAHDYKGTATAINNIGWESERFNFQIFYQAINTGSTATIIHLFNNTFYFSGVGSHNDNAIGGLNEQGDSSGLPYLVTIQNNISLEKYADQGNNPANGAVYAFLIGGNYTNSTIGGSGTENIFKGVRPACNGGGTCDAGFNVTAFNGGSFGTNTYVDPSFTNVTDLLNNRSGVPNCSGFTNVTACMGYDASTQTLTTPSVISDLKAGCAQCTGKGYQVPTNCQSVTDYPTWLKGVVYLRASGFINGATITEYSDLVTKPCGM